LVRRFVPNASTDSESDDVSPSKVLNPFAFLRTFGNIELNGRTSAYGRAKCTTHSEPHRHVVLGTLPARSNSK
jgi:hypothetical protein